jgi:hypothetical protein
MQEAQPAACSQCSQKQAQYQVVFCSNDIHFHRLIIKKKGVLNRKKSLLFAFHRKLLVVFMWKFVLL